MQGVCMGNDPVGSWVGTEWGGGKKCICGLIDDGDDGSDVA